MLKLEVGLRGEMFDTLLCFQDQITESWLKHIWLHCEQLQIHINMDLPDFQIPCQGDIELMQAFTQTWLLEQQVLHLKLMHLPVGDISSFMTSTKSPELAQFG